VVGVRNKLLGAALALVALLGAYGWLEGAQRDLAHARSLKDTAYIGSAQCKLCHPSHYESFARTYHSRMTRDADASTVLGSFDGRSVEYLGTTARMQQLDAQFWFSFADPRDKAPTRVRVERTVGSHRYQQYLARDGDVLFRLPIAWDVARKQFFHMNAAFLTADPVLDEGGLVSNVDYNRHVTRWNDNCIYCHNVHPNPGLDADTGQFDTRVAELGVACEACHGPGAEHAARNTDPVRRYALHSSGAADPSIRNPRRMSAARSAEVCGRCHGQRITPNIDHFHRQGDPFVPGEALSDYSTPLARETQQNGQEGLFRARFWGDGSPRLTAYEYQGYLQSPCRASEAFSCESCHAMHEGDPAGQMRPDRTGDAACTSCHEALRSPAAAAAHARHSPGSSGTACRSCHMPDIVYGLVSIHLSHRIESPAPQLQAAAGRPDACTLCHIDRTRSWASAARAEAGDPAAQRGVYAEAGDPAAQRGVSEVAYRLLAGDPIERAVAAHALGRASATAAPSFGPQRLGLLLDSAENDDYPAVRRIARASLEQLLHDDARALQLLAAYEPTAPHTDRQRALAALRAQLVVRAPDVQLSAALRAQAADSAIEIGE
jgi:hypothetical protein